MKRTKKPISKLSDQMKRKASQSSVKKSEYDGDTVEMISTGSTLLDLAISGGRIRGGGLPRGILVEIFGPSGSGKTVLLSELAGSIQRHGGQVMFHDPEARLNKQFAKMFDLNIDEMSYQTPDTVPQVFSEVRKWNPQPLNAIHGVFADSLAALSTGMEMEKDDGDKMGMRRAKEFSEELRKTCRILTRKKLLMVCSNQVRQNLDAGQFGQKYISPGGEAIGFYSSLRLRTFKPEKIKKKVKFAGKDVMREVGVNVQIEVFKSSVWKPYRKAPLTIIFDYGIDDIRQNLQFIKDYTTPPEPEEPEEPETEEQDKKKKKKVTPYIINGRKLNISMDKSIQIIERDGLEKELRNQVIDLWEDIESKFDSVRKNKKR